MKLKYSAHPQILSLMEPKGSLLSSQNHCSVNHPRHAESSSHPYILLLKDLS